MEGKNEVEQKAEAFDRMVQDLANMAPVECMIKKLAGLPLAKALEGFVIVPREEYKRLLTSSPTQVGNGRYGPNGH